MDVCVIGTGYAGLSTAVGLASKGHNVTCMDIDSARVESISSGVPPIYEEGMEEALRDALRQGKLRATTDLEKAMKGTKVSLICVPTPSNRDGSIDLSYIEHASMNMGKVLKGMDYHVVVVKSTVVPGTTEKVVIPSLEEHSGKKAGEGFGVCMVPEFLREGSALGDVLNPDRIVIGELDSRSGDALQELHSAFDAPVIRTCIRVAEMVKYASNAFLATKVSFANEMGNIAKRLGIDVYEVMKGVGLDKRISPHFLRAGVGFGGSCFPKDVQALRHKSGTMGYDANLLKEVLDLNARQPLRLVDLLRKRMGSLKGRDIAVLGLAFKAGTDDVRESPAISVVKELERMGARVRAHDPKAMENFRKLFPKTSMFRTPQEALHGAEACLVLTDWPQYRNLSDRDFSMMRSRLILEGRRALNPNRVSEFEGIAW